MASLGAVAVSFTHVVKALEPAVNAIASALVLGQARERAGERGGGKRDTSLLVAGWSTTRGSPGNTWRKDE